MNFIKHSNLEGLHAPFSASSSAWLRYDDEKIINTFNNLKQKEIGTRLHAWAKETIDLGQKLPRNKKTINMYINDAIGYKMSTEVVLYYSDYFFGTADAISFKNNILRIHDLKTGKSGHMEQLMVYAAIFCLEYKIKPGTLKDIILRLYIQDEVVECHPTTDEILHIMDLIKHFDSILKRMTCNQEDINND